MPGFSNHSRSRLGFLTFQSLLPAINSPQVMRLSRAEAPERLTEFYVRKFSGRYRRLLGTGVPEQLSCCWASARPATLAYLAWDCLALLETISFWLTFSLTVIHLHVAS